MTRPIQIVRNGYPETPGLDIALSRALLLRVSSGEVGETFRLNRPGRVVAFGKRDTIDSRYRAAAAVARKRGYEAVERLAGGRAAVFHEGTLAFSWSIHDPAPRERIGERFDALTALVVGAMGRLGIEGRVGELPGEYCPGTYSVHVGGLFKVMGVGQRLARNAAHVGGVIVVTGSDELREILDPVYEALGLQWAPSTGGSLEDAAPGITLEDAEEAVLSELAASYDVTTSALGAATVTLAESLAAEHLSP